MEETFDKQRIELIVGLGNDDKKYSGTRHNVGFQLLNYLNKSFNNNSLWQESPKLKCKFTEIHLENRSKKILLVKPTTFMNSSGNAVSAVSRYYKIKTESILVAHDDLDIDISNYKIQLGKGPKVHNGITSINNMLSSEKYWRLRIGIENRAEQSENKIPGIRYVLERFTSQESSMLQDTFKSIGSEII